MNGLLGNALLGYDKVQAVWNKGIPIPGYDPAIWRYDANGYVLRRDDHGNRSSEHGWEMDHFPVPASLGGTDDISNLRPLHWRANAEHGAALAAGLFAFRKNG